MPSPRIQNISQSKRWSLFGFLIIGYFAGKLLSPGHTDTKKVIDDTKIYDTTKLKDQLLFYRPSNANKFSAIFVSCQLDPACRIIYHHVQKTGGSLVASRLNPIIEENSEGINTGEQYNATRWCCGPNMMKRFRERPDYYCGLKLGIYETDGPIFGEVVRTCRQKTADAAGAKEESSVKRTREVAFITMREPIQRTMSQVNQQCNKGYDKKRPEVQAICDKCDYNWNKSGHFFDQFVTETNELYTGMARTIPFVLEQFRGVESHLLILDSVDIDSFFSDIEIASGRSFPQGGEKGENTEKVGHCSFPMPSSMMRGLKPALEVYRNWTMGKETFGP